MDSLFGGKLPEAANFVIAFVVVLLLIALLAWIVRRFSGGSRGGARGRQPRLGVVDAATVDARRRLILIRRDNVEHLLMIGGPTDLVIEPNIGRATASATEPTAVRTAPMPDVPSRPAPLDDAAAPPPAEPKLRASRSQALADLADILAPHAPATPSAGPQPEMVEPSQQQPAPPSPAPPVEPPVLTTPADAAQAAPEVHPEPPLAPRPDESRNSYENLRQEMASLLGRPQGKT